MATTMVSMERPKNPEKDSEEARMVGAIPTDQPKYSYGLVLRLENFELDKLKMKLPKVGSKVTVEAMGVIESVHESQSAHNRGERSVSIQITDLSVGNAEKV